jgi:hypothetical protein
MGLGTGYQWYCIINLNSHVAADVAWKQIMMEWKELDAEKDRQTRLKEAKKQVHEGEAEHLLTKCYLFFLFYL